ncbi:MAG: hypothetical protein Q4E62_07585 [Sutterellaceae bacterium]|nr:hypothetical protein [Sutterellaceae bacterium]
MKKYEISDIHYIPSRGNNAGKVMVPHQTKSGEYVVSMTRFQKDYVYVSTLEEILENVKKGFGIRMSVNGGPASLISAQRVIQQNPALFAENGVKHVTSGERGGASVDDIAGIRYVPSRGKAEGVIFQPQLTKSGEYVVSKTRFKEDYIYVTSYDEIIDYVKKGYGIRMGAEGFPASLVASATVMEQNPEKFK